MMERVGDFQSEGPGKMFQVFVRVLHGKGHPVLMLLHHSPLAFAHEPVFGDVIFASFVSEGAIPRTAHDGGRGWGECPLQKVSSPCQMMALPLSVRWSECISAPSVEMVALRWVL